MAADGLQQTWRQLRFPLTGPLIRCDGPGPRNESWSQSQRGGSGLSRADRDDGLFGNYSSRQACTFQGPLKAWAAPLIWGQTSCCLTPSLLPVGEEEEGEREGQGWGGCGFFFLLLLFFFWPPLAKSFLSSQSAKLRNIMAANNRWINNLVILTRGPKNWLQNVKSVFFFLTPRLAFHDVAAVFQRHQQINTIQVSLCVCVAVFYITDRLQTVHTFYLFLFLRICTTARHWSILIFTYCFKLKQITINQIYPWIFSASSCSLQDWMVVL